MYASFQAGFEPPKHDDDRDEVDEPKQRRRQAHGTMLEWPHPQADMEPTLDARADSAEARGG